MRPHPILRKIPQPPSTKRVIWAGVIAGTVLGVILYSSGARPSGNGNAALMPKWPKSLPQITGGCVVGGVVGPPKILFQNMGGKITKFLESVDKDRQALKTLGGNSQTKCHGMHDAENFQALSYSPSI
jgi:hypothetical protein